MILVRAAAGKNIRTAAVVNQLIKFSDTLHSDMNSESESLKEEVLRCTKCELAKTRNHVIFGEGNLNGGIFIIGEAPGRDSILVNPDHYSAHV